MLYLLRNQQGKAVVMAQAANQSEADEFGRKNIPDFCGESVELADEDQVQADEFANIQTVVVSTEATPRGRTGVRSKPKTPAFVITHVWVRGLELPEEVIADDLLTPEDHRDLALDHIARTSDFVAHVEIRKWARGRTRA